MTWEDWILIGLAVYAVYDVFASLWAACFAEKIIVESIAEQEIKQAEKKE